MTSRPWVRWFRFLLVPVLTLGLVMGGSAFDEQQRRWVFQPSKATWSSPGASKGLQEQWIAFDSTASGAPVKLHALWLPQPSAQAPVLLYLHGARWDVRGSAERLRHMHAMGFAVLGIDYRGFGRSTDAVPSEVTAHEDALAAWHWLGTQRPQAPRYVFGHSLGGAIAVHLASDVKDVSGLIVEGTFTSVPDVFSTFKWGWLPVGPLITQRFDSASRMAQVKVPVLVIHGANDRYILPSLGKALYERAPGPKRFLLVKGGTHRNANALGKPEFRKAMDELFGLSLPRKAV
ncbi:MAG: hypothetical protein RLZZ618_1673 [Pseudomonadota bacterium]|jgi:alpha-beta hydrolase superfamily lysophospholipase